MALLVLEFHVLITVELLHNGHLGDRRKWPLLGGTGEIRNMYGGGHKLGPHHTNVCKFSQICRAISSFAYCVRHITFKFGNVTNIKALFTVVSKDFP